VRRGVRRRTPLGDVIVFNNRMRYHGGFVICQTVAASWMALEFARS
jgi:hypothetical protein